MHTDPLLGKAYHETLLEAENEIPLVLNFGREEGHIHTDQIHTVDMLETLDEENMELGTPALVLHSGDVEEVACAEGENWVASQEEAWGDIQVENGQKNMDPCYSRKQRKEDFATIHKQNTSLLSYRLYCPALFPFDAHFHREDLKGLIN